MRCSAHLSVPAVGPFVSRMLGEVSMAFSASRLPSIVQPWEPLTVQLVGIVESTDSATSIALLHTASSRVPARGSGIVDSAQPPTGGFLAGNLRQRSHPLNPHRRLGVQSEASCIPCVCHPSGGLTSLILLRCDRRRKCKQDTSVHRSHAFYIFGRNAHPLYSVSGR